MLQPQLRRRSRTPQRRPSLRVRAPSRCWAASASPGTTLCIATTSGPSGLMPSRATGHGSAPPSPRHCSISRSKERSPDAELGDAGGAIDHAQGDVTEPKAMIARVGTQHLKCPVDAHVVSLCKDTLRLFNDDAAVQCSLQLLGEHLAA